MTTKWGSNGSGVGPQLMYKNAGLRAVGALDLSSQIRVAVSFEKYEYLLQSMPGPKLQHGQQAVWERGGGSGAAEEQGEDEEITVRFP
jgi:hypothetical protein